MNIDSEVHETYQIWPEEDVHGSDGFVQVSYPNYIYEQSGNNELYLPSGFIICMF